MAESFWPRRVAGEWYEMTIYLFYSKAWETYFSCQIKKTKQNDVLFISKSTTGKHGLQSLVLDTDAASSAAHQVPGAGGLARSICFHRLVQLVYL